MWLRKSVEKLTGSSRGFSSVIGTIFMVLLVVTSIAGVFLSTLYQNTLYNYAVRGQNQQELDARNENVVANGNYSVPSPGKVSVIANLTNAGPVTAQIVNLWVFDTSKQTYGFNNSVGNKPWANLTWTTLKAGQVLKFTSGNATKVTVPSAVSGDSFNIWFVTARGNTVPLTKSQSTTVINAQTSQGIGSIAMDFNSFVYYDVSNPSSNKYRLSGWPAGLSGYVLPNGVNIAFRVNVTNFDPQKRSLTFNALSAVWVIAQANNPQQPLSTWWQIVNVNGTGWITSLTPTTFSNVPLTYGGTTTLYFASSQVLSSSYSKNDFAMQQFGFASNQHPTLGVVNLVLFGTIGTSTTPNYGQNIPFVTVYIP